MPCEAGWLLKDQVFEIIYRGDVTTEDTQQAGRAVLPVLDNATGIVHVIFNMTEITHLSAKLGDMANSPRMSAFYSHPHIGWTIYIGPENNPFYHFVAVALAQKHSGRMRWFTHQGEAMIFLMDRDPSLQVSV